MFKIKSFLRGYVECALWASVDCESGELLDSLCDASDISDECMRRMRSDCYDFIRLNFADLCEYAACASAESAGHDFWLTRNRHGAGFWDRGLVELGDRLANAARAYGSIDLFIDNDRKVNS